MEDPLHFFQWQSLLDTRMDLRLTYLRVTKERFPLALYHTPRRNRLILASVSSLPQAYPRCASISRREPVDYYKSLKIIERLKLQQV